MRDRPGFVAIFGVVMLLCVFMATVFLMGEFATSVSAPSPITVEVRRGESLTRFAQRLAREGVLSNPRFFRLLAILRGDTGRVRAGDYVLKGSVSPNELLDYLVSGRAKFISLTIPEGFNLRDIGRRIEEKELGSAAEFLALAVDPAFIAKLGLPFAMAKSTVEGMIFPDTYFFHRGVRPARLIEMMVYAYKEKAYQISAQGAHKVGLTPYEVVILASIIEKETGLGSERRLISAVFHNRLKTRMRLGSDPTVIYGIKAFDGNLTRAHLRQRTEYNTYKIRGLPPTPIANPGLASLRAAVDPADVNFLYFVSKGDGSHFFSSSLKSHNRAVWKYQKRRFRKRRS